MYALQRGARVGESSRSVQDAPERTDGDGTDVERPDKPSREPVELERVRDLGVPPREHEAQPLVVEPAERVAEYGSRVGVEPLRIVDGDDGRAPVCEQAQEEREEGDRDGRLRGRVR